MSLTLTINCGSSSLKFAVYENEPTKNCLYRGQIERIGSPPGKFKVKETSGDKLFESESQAQDHHSALATIFDYLKENKVGEKITRVGHRIVFGGVEFEKPAIVDDFILGKLENLVPYAPLHMPPAVMALKSALKLLPDATHVACFDSSFHRTNPPFIRRLPLPDELCNEGLEKFGFHGLSYEFIVERIKELYGEEEATKRLIVAHLGHGASICAIRDGKSFDTTMGFSPNSGLVMSTRSGELDPGIFSYLVKEKGLSIEEIEDLVNHKSGLLAISDTTADMVTLLKESAEGNDKARLAIDVFINRVKKQLAALTASLGGVDMIVFTGGIGENSAAIREMILDGLKFLGIHYDPERNEASELEITDNDSFVKVLVIPTDEEKMIAEHCRSL